MRRKEREDTQDAKTKEVQRGHELFMQNRFSQAVRVFTRALKSELPVEWEVRARYDRALCQTERKKYRKAIADYDAILSIEPSRGDVLYNRGLCFQACSNPEQATADWWEAAQCPTPEPKALVMIAHGLYHNGDILAAVEYYQRAINLQPELIDFVHPEIISRIHR